MNVGRYYLKTAWETFSETWWRRKEGKGGREKEGGVYIPERRRVTDGSRSDHAVDLGDQLGQPVALKQRFRLAWPPERVCQRPFRAVDQGNLNDDWPISVSATPDQPSATESSLAPSVTGPTMLTSPRRRCRIRRWKDG